MGDKVLEFKRNEPQASYKIVTYKGTELPEEYKTLIKASFLNTLRYGNDYFKLIDKGAFFPQYGKYIEFLLSRSMIRLAILDDEVILGWCLYENKTLHFIWVKQEVKRQGIGRALAPKEFDTISHITRVGLSIWGSRLKDVRFNPFV